MRLLVALSLLTLLPAAALRAEELRLGITSEFGYDSNAFGNVREKVGDYRLQVDPRVRLADREGHLRWRIDYQPSYVYYVESGATRDWNHFVNANLGWDATARTKLTGFARFAMVDSLTSLQSQEALAGGDVVIETERGARSSRLYSLGGSLQHSFTHVHQATLSARYFMNNRDVGRDSSGFTASASWLRTLTRRTQVGISGAFTRQELSATELDASRSTDFYNVSASLQHSFDPTLQVSVSIGPSFVKNNAVAGNVPDSFVVALFPLLTSEDGVTGPVDASTCPTQDGRPFLATGCEPLDAGLTPQQISFLRGFGVSVPAEEGLGAGGGSTTTYFANVSLAKSWDTANWTLFYRRTTTDQATEQLGSSSVADILGAIFYWQPASRWTLRASATWVRQQRATDFRAPTVVLGVLPEDVLFVPAGAGFATAVAPFAVDQDFEIVQYNLFATLRYRWRSDTSLFFRVSFYQQDQNVGGETLVSRDRWTIGAGFTYEFDPIRF